VSGFGTRRRGGAKSRGGAAGMVDDHLRLEISKLRARRVVLAGEDA
jgi:hypothetical protein